MVSVLALVVAIAGAVWEYRRMMGLIRRIETEKRETRGIN